ncbi:MAG TPA: phytanoyl-CoA dioxygenase family protein [Streptosporangiaceae bacterium]
MDHATRESHLQQIHEQGYTVVEEALDPALTEALREDIHRVERALGVTVADNDFEGRHTLRTHNLLAHGPLYASLAVHPDVLPLVDLVLGPGCLLSMMGSITIGPEETAQPIHADDQIFPIAKPHRAVVCNTMWAISDFTGDNGATQVVPRSHLADRSPEYGARCESIPVEMAKGSVLIWHGSLWHGGGANRAGNSRVGVSAIYCAGYLRQEENQQLGIPKEMALGFPPRLQELVGYGVYMGVLGHIYRESPASFFRGSSHGRRSISETGRYDNATISAWRGM